MDVQSLSYVLHIICLALHGFEPRALAELAQLNWALAHGLAA